MYINSASSFFIPSKIGKSDGKVSNLTLFKPITINNPHFSIGYLQSENIPDEFKLKIQNIVDAANFFINEHHKQAEKQGGKLLKKTVKSVTPKKTTKTVKPKKTTEKKAPPKKTTKTVTPEKKVTPKKKVTTEKRK